MRGHAARAVALAAALLAGTSAAAAAAPLAADYAQLGERPGDEPRIRDPRSAPLALPGGGPAAAWPLRGPTRVRIDGGAILVDETMTGRVLRLGPRGRVAVVQGRRAAYMPACAPHRSGAARVWADPGDNRVYRATGPGTRVTIAGTPRTGLAGDGGQATASRLNGPTCAVTMADGGVLVADRGNGRIRRIAPDGTIATVAGGGAGMLPQELAVLPGGAAVLISDPPHARVLRLDPNGTLTTVAGTGAPGWDGDGGPATRARLTMPWGLAVASDGGVVVSDFGSQTVRRISPSGTITTVLGAPPQRTASPSRARRAVVPARRSVAYWLGDGRTGVSEEAAAGARAVIRARGTGGATSEVTVVRGPSTLGWADEYEPGCWSGGATATGLRGDPLQARDLQAATGAAAPYAPGAGPYAPDLARGELVLARALVRGDDRPAFGVPAWATSWWGQRVVEWLIHRPSGRVVAMQAWSVDGLQRRYRIATAHGRLAMPATRPRLHIVSVTSQMTRLRCGPVGRDVRFAYGFRGGLALARRVTRRLERTPALRVRADGRSAVGRDFTVRALLVLDGARVREEVRQVATADARGPACRVRPGPDPFGEAAAERARVMPFEDAFFERPRRRGRLLALRAYTRGLTVDSLVDPRDMRLVGQRWTGWPGRGRLSLTEVRSVPPLPAPEPRCPTGEAG